MTAIAEDIKEAKAFLALYPGRKLQLEVLRIAKLKDMAKAETPGARKFLRKHARQWARDALNELKETAARNG